MKERPRITTPRELTKFLKPYDPAVQDLALKLRRLVLDEMGPCYENIYDAYSAVAIGYGFSSRLRDGVCHVAVYSEHVNLGFNFGSALPDPHGMLEGSGKQIRHIKIRNEGDLANPQVASYLRAACKMLIDDARKLGEPPPERPSKVISVVKAVYKNKRRPAVKG
jgi:hypothetical protein